MLLVVPVAVGIPEITPDELSINPDGNDPEVIAQDEYVPLPPVAANLNEYETPTCPPVNGEVLETLNGAAAVVKLRIDPVLVPSEFVPAAR